MNKSIVRIIALFLSVFFLSQAAHAGDRTIDIGGRPVEVYSPDGMEKRISPLIILMHGGGGSADQLKRTLDFTPIARQKRFHIAYINGTQTVSQLSEPGPSSSLGRTWNAGNCCNEPKDKTVDDVAYIDSVITYFIKQGIADPRYVYLLGHSNGAMMAYRYACEHGSRLYGIIPISATMVVEKPCTDMQGVKVLHIHGTKDRSVPIQGGMPLDNDSPILKRLEEPFPSVVENKKMALKGGASIVDVKLVQEAEHAIDTINFQLKKKTGYDIQSLVFMYFNDGVDRFPTYK